MYSSCRKRGSRAAGQRGSNLLLTALFLLVILFGELLSTVPLATAQQPRGAAAQLATVPRPRSPAAPLRVCSDPNNLPFSNARREGLENRLAELIARDLGAEVRYVWWAQRRGFIRNTLDAGLCDVVMGVPDGLPSVLTTRPYYRSSYVFVSRADRKVTVDSFDDPRLARLRIGVQVVGDGANTPPMDALARSGLAPRLVGYTVYGDYATPNPPARIMDAVARGEVDIAVVWGPLAGFFAGRLPVRLELTRVLARAWPVGVPPGFSISMGVRKDDDALRASLDRILERRRVEIERILDAYAVPRVD